MSSESKVKVEDESQGVLIPPPFCDPGGGCCEEPSVGGAEDVELNKKGKLKSTCEKCSTAKVKCSGEIPCERCARRGFNCEYKMEKKRGRRTVTKGKKDNVCSDASCWGQVIMNPITKYEDFGGRFGLESVERRVFQIFFAIYKHHATPQSCCKSWFTYQLNKMSCFLLSNGNKAGQEKLDAWMRKKGIEVTKHDPKQYSKIPANVVDEATGIKLPPIHPMKGPKMYVAEPSQTTKRKRTSGTQVYSTRGFYRSDLKGSPVDRDIQSWKTSGCYLNLRCTHESFEVEVNDEFTALFGYTNQAISDILVKLFGGLLPWGCDILAILLANDSDLLFFLRTLALKMNQIGRPAQFPATRQAVSNHIFEFETKAGDIVECFTKCVHREYLSMERTEVDIYMNMQPMMEDVPRKFMNEQINNKAKRLHHDMDYNGDTLLMDYDYPQQTEQNSPSYFNNAPLIHQQPPSIPVNHTAPPQYMNENSNVKDIPANELVGLDFLENMLGWVGDEASESNTQYQETGQKPCAVEMLPEEMSKTQI